MICTCTLASFAPVALRHRGRRAVPALVEIVDPMVSHDVTGGDGDRCDRGLDDVIEVDDRLEPGRRVADHAEHCGRHHRLGVDDDEEDAALVVRPVFLLHGRGVVAPRVLEDLSLDLSGNVRERVGALDLETREPIAHETGLHRKEFAGERVPLLVAEVVGVLPRRQGRTWGARDIRHP
jgi:hypothetical protein